jgi:glycosyltransferase involved in cell wall biosynthesis
VEGVSVIICCYNSAQRIVPTLQHLQNQFFEIPISWEIILVDNNSTDNTIEIATDFWAKNPITQFTILKETQIGQAYARNKGVENANYNVLSYIDDDNWVPANWISTVFESFDTNPNMGVLGCNIEASFETPAPNWINKYLDGYAIGQLYQQSNVTDLGAVYGAGMCIRKEALDLLKTKGWKAYLSGRSMKKLYGGDDSELCYAVRLIGYQIFYDKALTIKHFIPKERVNINYLLNLFRGFGRSDMVLQAYNIVYAEKKGVNDISLQIRKKWYFHALMCVKRIIFKYHSLPFVKSENPNKVRQDAFLEEIFTERKKYKLIIKQLESLK